jgi:hypothetical protein
MLNAVDMILSTWMAASLILSIAMLVMLTAGVQVSRRFEACAVAFVFGPVVILALLAVAWWLPRW